MLVVRKMSFQQMSRSKILLPIVLLFELLQDFCPSKHWLFNAKNFDSCYERLLVRNGHRAGPLNLGVCNSKKVIGWKRCGGTAKVPFVEGVSRFVRLSYAKRNMRHGVQDSNLQSYTNMSRL
jgi:hypothetical protein